MKKVKTFGGAFPAFGGRGISAFSRAVVILAALSATAPFAAAVSSQATCASPTATPVIVRAEGRAEAVAGFTIVCTGVTSGADVAPTTGSTVLTVVLSAPVANSLSTTGDALAWATGFSGSPSHGTVSGSVLTFTGLSTPLVATAAVANTYTFTVVNVRADLNPPAGTVASPVTVMTSVSGPAIATSSPTPATVAAISKGMVTPKFTATPNNYFVCAGGGNSNTSPNGGLSFSVDVAENLNDAFRTLAQEAGAGSASFGTRIQVVFNNLPATGETVYLPTTISNGTLKLMATTTATGAFTSVTATGGGSIPNITTAGTNKTTYPAGFPTAEASAFVAGNVFAVPQVGGSATAYYEVTASNTAATESFSIPVWVYSAAGSLAPRSGVTARVSFVPASPASAPYFTATTNPALTGSALQLCGNPAGTLTAASPLTTGSGPIAVVTTDFNNDGKLDLAVADSTAGDVRIYLGTGVSGGFTPTGSITLGTVSILHGTALVAGDFNGDGKQDLAVGTDGNSIVVLLGNGAGGFTSSSVALGKIPAYLAVGDFNGDGIQDLVSANQSLSTISVLPGNGAGGFTVSVSNIFTVGTTPVAVAVADFNGDGFQDIAVTNVFDFTVTVLLGNGAIGFTPATGSPLAVGTSPRGIVAGDFNGDGKPDLAVANQASDSVTVLLGDGSGGFTSSTIAAGTAPFAIIQGDFNGDGFTDLAVSNDNSVSSGGVSVLLGNGAGVFVRKPSSSFDTGLAPHFLAAGDFNGDGVQDIVTANSSSASASILLGSHAVTTTVVFAADGPATSPVGLLATVSASAAFNTPTGTLQFYDGAVIPANLLGSAPQTTAPYILPVTLPVGSHTINAVYAGDTRNLTSTGTISPAVTVYPAPQFITFGPPVASPVTFGASPITLTASSTSGLTVTFAGTSGVCTASGTTLTIVGVGGGTCTVTASQPGNATYAAADDVVRSFTVLKASQTITFSALSDRVYNGTPFSVGATASSGLTVSFSSSTTAFCTVSGTSVTMVKPGTCTITASQAGSSNYNPATDVPRSFSITQIPQSISFSPLSDVPLSTGFVSLDAFSTSEMPLTFTSTTLTVCTVSDGGVVLLTGGLCSITATQPGDTYYAAATPVTQSFTIGPSTQWVHLESIPDQILGISPFPVYARASSGLPVAITSTTPSICRAASGLITLLAEGNCIISASQPGNASYSSASTTRSFWIYVAYPSGTLFTAELSPFNAYASPNSIVKADFNCDGILDIAISTTGSGAGNVQVYLGDDSGDFTAVDGTAYSTDGSVSSLVTGDFNGDNRPDIAFVANGSVVVMLGYGGSGYFSEPDGPAPPTGEVTASYLTVGDFDGDGIEDIAATASLSAKVLLLKGNGHGFFTTFPVGLISVGSAPGHITVADFNNDGKQDLVVVNSGESTISVLRGDGAGGFTNFSGSPIFLTSAPFAVAAGDLNGDGKTDIALTSGSSVTVLLGNGYGTFTSAAGSPFATSPGTNAVKIADMNGDGFTDLVMTSNTLNAAMVLIGDGTGSFGSSTLKTFSVGSGPVDLVLGDFDDEGNMDVATADAGGSTFSVLLTDYVNSVAVMTNTSPLSIPNGGSVGLSVALTDYETAFNPPTGYISFYDGDTFLGYASQTASPYTFTVSGLSTGTHYVTAFYEGDDRTNETDSNTLTISVAPPLLSQSISFGTLPDVPFGSAPFTISASATSEGPIVFSSLTTFVCTVSGSTVTVGAVGTCSIQANQAGNSTYAPAPPVTRSFAVTGPTITFTAIPTQRLGTSPFQVSVKTSSALTPLTITSSTSTICTIASGLVTLLHAGTCTLTASQAGATSAVRNFSVAAATGSGTMSVIAGPTIIPPVTFGGDEAALTRDGSSSGRRSTAKFAGPTAAPYSVVAGDFNGDGYRDFATANLTGYVTVWLGDNSGGFTEASGSPFFVGSSPVFVTTGDFNGDGKQDLAVASSGGNTVSVLLGSGTGTFALGPGSPMDAGGGPAGIAVGDFNGDLIQDLAVANSSGNSVSVFLGNGLGGFTTAPSSPFAVLAGPHAIAVADFNGDGKQDLAVANTTAGSVTVLLGNGSAGFSPAASSPFVTGAGPLSVIVADFNGDGRPDFATANTGDSNISVRLGNGAGGFTTPAGATPATGTNPFYIVAADFNGDGNADLATADFGNNDVSMFLGSGAGGFTTAPGAPFAVGTGPTSLAVGDFNGDGRADLITTNDSSSDTSLLLGAKVATATSVSATSTTIPQGSAAALTVTVADSGAAFAAPTGTVTFTEPIGDGITFGNASQTSSPWTFNVTGLLAGDHMIQATYNGDSRSFSSGKSIVIHVTAPLLSQTITFVQPATVTLGSASFAATVSSSSGLVVTLTSNSPTICSVSGTVITLLAAGSCSITATQDGNSTTSPATPVTRVFGITTITSQTITFPAIGDIPFGTAPFALGASASSGLPVSYSTGSAGVCSISGNIVTLLGAGSCSITASQGGSSTVSAALSVTRAFSVILVPLAVTPGTLTVGAGVGGTLSGGFTIVGGLPPYTVSATGLPTGVSLSSLGVVSGSSSTAGNFEVTVSVTDSKPTTVPAHLSIRIIDIAPATLTPGVAQVLYSANFTATGGTAPYTFASGNLPTGFSLAANGSLSGTADLAGTFPFTVNITDGSGIAASKSYSLEIKPGPVTVKSKALSDGKAGTPFSDTVTATGGTGKFTWSILSGTLPAGLAFSSGGTISGTPGDPGTFSFAAQATDTSGGVGSGSVTFTIKPAPIVLNTSALPSGVVNFDYPSQVLSATGGTAPYSFSISAGTLPTGLTLSAGVISGTPTVAGTSAVTISVTDAAGANAKSSVSLVIRPADTDLVLLAGNISFSLVTGATALPGSQSVGVQSTLVATPVNYTISVSPSAPWLSVSGGGVTPGALSLSLTSAALSLSAGTNATTVTLTCTSPGCAGKTQNLAVSLTVTSPPPQLSVNSGLIAFSSATVPPTAQTQSFGIQNAGGGSITVNSVSCSAPWCSITSAPSTLLPGPTSQIGIKADPAGLANGFYLSSVNIATSVGNASVPVTFFVSSSLSMNLAPAGSQFSMPAGGAPGNANGSFLVSTSGGSLSWSASVLPGAPWLSLVSSSGSSTTLTPGMVTFSINPSIASLLDPKAYYGTIRVASEGAVNSPQDYQVVLNVAPATSLAKPDPEPAGLIFLTVPGGTPPAQIVKVYSSSSVAKGYTLAAATETGSWLSASASVGQTSSAAPGQSVVMVNAAGLGIGVYQGGVSYAFDSSGVRTVNVTLIVQNPDSAASLKANALTSKAEAPAATCSAKALVPTQTGLVNNFSAPASWPTPLAVTLFNDCGRAVPDGQVVATFSNGDPPLALSLADANNGLYAATWTPRKSAGQVTIQARATAGSLPAVTTQIAGSVIPNATPILSPNGIVHAYNPLVGAAVAPGTLVEIFGANLASTIGQPATTPIPTSMNGTSVLIGGIPAPLLYVSPGQINAQVPFELDSSKQYQIVVTANGALTTPQPIQTAPNTPGLAAFPDGTLIAVHSSDSSLITQSSPAKPGEYIVMFLLGMGNTDNAVKSGDPALADPLSRPITPPTLTLGGVSVPVAFAGLTPGFVGLYQINLQVPAGTPDGNIVLKVSQNDSVSNTTILPIHK